VVNDPVGGDGSREIAHDLADFDDDAPGWVDVEAQRLDVGIDDGPLAGPVLAYLAVTVHVPAFHFVRPLDVRMHGRERPVEVTGIEGVVGGPEDVALRGHRAVFQIPRAL